MLDKKYDISKSLISVIVEAVISGLINSENKQKNIANERRTECSGYTVFRPQNPVSENKDNNQKRVNCKPEKLGKKASKKQKRCEEEKAVYANYYEKVMKDKKDKKINLNSLHQDRKRERPSIKK